MHRVFDSPTDCLVVRHRPPGLRAQAPHRPGGRLRSTSVRRAASRATRTGPSPTTTGSRTPTPRRRLSYAYGDRERRFHGPERARTGPAAALSWPLVGDGALTGGHGLRGAEQPRPRLGCGCSIVLNDNGRSYAPTVSKLSELAHPAPPRARRYGALRDRVRHDDPRTPRASASSPATSSATSPRLFVSWSSRTSSSRRSASATPARSTATTSRP